DSCAGESSRRHDCCSLFLCSYADHPDLHSFPTRRSSDLSPYTITCAPGTLSAANYNFVTGDTAHFTITKATLSVNAVADTKVYGDRKSTRLNSSHVAISYAVFCLKKKTRESQRGLPVQHS